ncbi:MAG: CHAT domain-containing protein, partial [Anaerolineae bacterium]
MRKIALLDFVLLIEQGRGKRYPVRVIASPAGEAKGTFVRPFTPGQLEGIKTIIELAMLRSRLRTRAALAKELRRIRKFGGDLFDALFKDDIRSCYEASLRLAYSQGKGLRLKLRLEPPDLADVPWEFLYDKGGRKFLALSIRTTLVRYLELPYSAKPLHVHPPMRFLVMISSPLDLEPLDVEREKRRLREALKELEAQGLVEFEFMAEATLPALQNRLREGEFHIFHFIGHGGYEEEEGKGVLILEDERKRSKPVRGEHLGKLLGDHFPLRLAVLNACEAGRTSRLQVGPYESFSGVAETLVYERIPAVVAMQFEITDEAAILFAREFYAALADNYPVDAAVAEARKAIDYTLKNTVEWATPVLYMRAPDGMIFQVPPRAREEARERKVARLYSQAKEAMAAARWREAIALLQQVLALQPDHQKAAATLAQAEAELAKGEGLVRAWRQALTLGS